MPARHKDRPSIRETVLAALSVTTGCYAECDPAAKQAVRENWQKMSGFGKDIALFLASMVEGRAGHLDIASGKRR